MDARESVTRLPATLAHLAFFPYFSGLGLARIQVHYARRRGNDWETIIPSYTYSGLPTDLHLPALRSPAHHLGYWLLHPRPIVRALSEMLREPLHEVRVVLDGGIYIPEESFDELEMILSREIPLDAELARLISPSSENPSSKLFSTIAQVLQQVRSAQEPYLEFFVDGGMGTLLLRDEAESQASLQGLNLGFQDPALEIQRHELPDETIMALFEQAVSALQRDETEQALPLLKRITAAEPALGEAQRLLGDLYLHQGAYRDAIAHLDVAELGHIDGPETLSQIQHSRATAWHLLSDHQRALRDYNSAIHQAEEGDCRDALHYANRAELFLDLLDLEEAELDLESALSLDPEQEHALELQERLKELRTTASDKKSEEDEHLPDLLEIATLLRVRAGGPSTLEHPSDYVTPLQQAGRKLAEAGKHKKAVAQFTRALQEFPNNQSIHSDRGESLRLLNRYEEAFEDARFALEVDSRNPLFLHRLALLLADLDNDEEALLMWDLAIQAQPQFFEAHLERAYFHLRRKNHLPAKKDLVIVLKLDPEHALATANLARAEERLGNLVEAQKLYERSLQLNPKDSDVKKAYKQFLKSLRG